MVRCSSSLRLRLSFVVPSLVSLTLTAGLGGCSTASVAVSAPLADRPAGQHVPTVPSALVWTGAQGAPRETWVLDAQGRVLEHRPGVRIAVHGRVWQWNQTTEPVETQACPRYDDDGHELPEAGPAPEAGSGVRAALERVDGAEGGEHDEHDEIVAPIGSDGAQDLEQTVDLVATVGPYLFVRESVYAYTCGAHGNTSVSYRVWDAQQHKARWDSTDTESDGADDDVAAEAPLPVEASLASEALTQALAVLGADEDVSSFGADGRVEATLTEMVPSYEGPDGALGVSLQFTAASCYACSDGAWSSYTKSTLQPLSTLPAWLRAWATPPESVRAFLRAHPGAAIGGWSTRTGS